LAAATAAGREPGRPAPRLQGRPESIPGWDQQPSRKTRDEARWHQRLAELIDYMAAGNDWPRHKKTDSEQERALGVWLHIQRMKHRGRELHEEKETQLNSDLPGWRAGRVRGRRRRA
jgi:hypothetical protein